MNNDFYNENSENKETTSPLGDENPAENTDANESSESQNRPFNTEPEHKVFESEPAVEPEPREKYINMQHKRKKTPGWIIVLICIFGALYLAASIFFISTLIRDNNSSFKKPLPSFFSEEPLDSIPDESDSGGKTEEHLIQNESPMSAGAKTTEGALTVKQISQKVRTSVVGVIGQSANSFSSSSVGSGIIMSSDGYIITNNHVIEGMTAINVVLDDGTSYNARVIGSDARTDLAVIKVDAKNLVPAEFGDSDKLEQGDPAIAIGNPAGLQLQNTVTSGIISAINRDIIIEDRTMTLIQTDASINPGNSGGPLVNEFGQVIGINTIKVGISYYEGLGFAIPINTAKPIIDELISNGYIKGRPSIGINGQSISARDAAFYGLPEGLYVEYVHPHSDAFRKGLRRGDVITKMNGTKLSSTAEIKKIRDNFKAGDKVTITIFRNGKETDMTILLMDEAMLSSYGEPS